MKSMIRIGNAQGFWGDSSDAPRELVAQTPDLDYLTLDYLAEVSLSILALQRDRDPQAGFPRDFLSVIDSLIPFWKSGRTFKLIANAGGLAPLACGKAVAHKLSSAGLDRLKVSVVHGDDCLPFLKAASAGEFPNLDSGSSIETVRDRLVTANAYIGAAPVVNALQLGADIVVTGRVADPSLTLAPAIYEFGWADDDWDKLAAGTIAGHLIECGAQVTGGLSTDWLDVDNSSQIGFPIVEVSADGSILLTKPQGTGGRVNRWTVTEQLLYEIGDPDHYISPDCEVSFLNIRLEEMGSDRVRLTGVKGRPATPFYKVSGTFSEGFRASGMLTICGADAVLKAERSGKIIQEKLARLGIVPEEFLVEVLGTGSAVNRIITGVPPANLWEVVLRVGVRDPRKDVVDRFTKEIAPLVTAGAQGTTGYAAGRPSVSPVFGFWPCLIEKSKLQVKAEIINRS